MNEHDLSKLDRNTLRAWRVGNLVTWGLVGMVAAATTVVVGAFLVGIVPASVLAGAIDGWIVGSKVYRSPALVALGALILPILLGVLRLVTGGSYELQVLLLVLTVPGVVVPALAAIVATLVWRRRPAALRGGPPVQAPAAPGQPQPTS